MVRVPRRGDGFDVVLRHSGELGKNDSSESLITGWQFNAGERTGAGTAKQMGLWVLLVSALVYSL